MTFLVASTASNDSMESIMDSYCARVSCAAGAGAR